MCDIPKCDVIYYVIYTICSHNARKAISPLFVVASSVTLVQMKYNVVFFALTILSPCKVRNETETERNEKKQTETKRNKSKRNETDKNETNRNETNNMVSHCGQISLFSNLINYFLILESHLLILGNSFSHIRKLICIYQKYALFFNIRK